MSASIRFENVSKQYRLGQTGTGTLAHDINRAWAKLRRRPDPYEKVGVINNREEIGGDYVWALKDITFEVPEGKVFGIIGRNGAGKSTLLKILSRVTAPTDGVVKVKGKIASLLEVGTGFHPELTGRENIFLNGSILGMSRIEIKRQLDEIVEFSGCGKYLDTPTKRYSSGMVVRLGFAVAAHLTCQILVVDEVLAVGDAEFQKKCITKLQDVTKANGRTVLFVSHNMGAISSLCEQCCLLQNGQVQLVSDTETAIKGYLSNKQGILPVLNDFRLPGMSRSIEIVNLTLASGNANCLSLDEAISVDMEILLNTPETSCSLGGSIFSESSGNVGTFFRDISLPQGKQKIKIRISISDIPFASGNFYMAFSIGRAGGGEKFDCIIGYPQFEIEAVSKLRKNSLHWSHLEWGPLNIGQKNLNVAILNT